VTAGDAPQSDAGHQPGTDQPGDQAGRRQHGELGKRLVSAVVMAALAIAAVFAGGLPFLMFWTAAAIGVYFEWSAMTEGPALRARALATAALAAAALLAWFLGPGAALAALLAGAAVVAALDRSRRRVWRGAGVLYAGTALLAPWVLRSDRELGLLALLFLFAVVWSTDVFGYFVGRAVGGPRLAPVVSPNKTWSGALGGALGAVTMGVLAVAAVATGVGPASVGTAGAGSTAVVALALSIASQAGDLFESGVKRRFGVKDASHVIPGHGGLMDRLDGFIAACGVAALLGLMRGGLDAPARGFLLW